MRWSEIDLDKGTWTIPAARLKNGAKTGRAHELPLPDMALEILQTIPRGSRDQLFGEHSRGFTSWAGGKRELDARSGVTGWTVHDIRRSVATGMANRGVAPHAIEAVLNHVSGTRAGVSGIYNRSTYEPEKRAALILWADHVAALVGGERKVLAFKPSA